ncbi:MAG: hypothetical protein IJ389_05700 [Clostridia bacterium]|nr:hypothetical protein [Clostridia bacterium]
MKKAKHNRKYVERRTYVDGIVESPLGLLIVGILAIIMGTVFILSQNANTPIAREDATSYVGEFESYVSERNYSDLNFTDGTTLSVYPHTETQDFIDIMHSLPRGTRLHVLINPNNDYVAEIKTDTMELLNFESSQQRIADYDNGYVAIGIFAVAGGAFLIIYGIARRLNDKKETARKKAPKKSGAIRYADQAKHERILLEANVEGYNICYRRVKHTNELIVNGKVYDELKGILEFSHKLSATVGEHTVEAGFDEHAGESYISFDNRIIKRKKRLF